MILSSQLIFSDDQAITVTADSTNVVDLGVPGTPYGGKAALHQDVGKGTKVPILAQVTESFTSASSGVMTISVSIGATTALGTKIVSVGPIAKADLVAGYQIPIDVLPNQLTERYLGMEYVVGTDPMTAGKITAGISMGNQTNVTGA